MNKNFTALFLKISFAIFLFAALGANTYSQRCGDGVLFNITDDSGKMLDSGHVKISGYIYDHFFSHGKSDLKKGEKLKYKPFYSNYGDSLYSTEIGMAKQWKDGGVYVRTFCGLYLMVVIVNYGNSDMELDLYNVPGDIPIKTGAFPFKEGKYEININGYLDLENFTKDTDGYYIIKNESFKTVN